MPGRVLGIGVISEQGKFSEFRVYRGRIKVTYSMKEIKQLDPEICFKSMGTWKLPLAVEGRIA